MMKLSEVAHLFLELFIPLTLRVIKFNLCLFNHNCLWKQPACEAAPFARK